MDTQTLAWGVVLITAAVFLSGIFIAFVYVAVRAAALAWYRTKLEHLRDVIKHLGRNGDAL